MVIKHLHAGTPKGWVQSTYNSAQEPQFYSKSVDYINCIPQLVGIATREGLKIFPEYCNIDHGPYLIIRIRFKFRTSIKQQMIEQWRAGHYANTDMQQIIQDQWISNRNIHGRCDLFLEYKIHESQIIENGGIVYIPAADCTVGVGSRIKIEGQLYHPGTIEGNIIEAASSSLSGDLRTAEHSSDYCYHIRIVDNSGTIGPKWISFGSFISKIVPVKHPGIKDGYYVTRTVDSDNRSQGNNSLVSDYYEKAEDIKCVHVCESYARAASTPSYEAASKEKLFIAEVEARLAKTKSDLDAYTRSVEKDELKHRLDMEKLNNDMKKINEERLKYKEEAELLNHKLKSEKISIWRKNIGDSLKYVPVIIATAMTVIKMFKPA